jgi:hypothetical protein
LRKALIAGFFDKVEDAVRREFGAAVDRNEIAIAGLGRVDPRHGLNFDTFKAALTSLTANTDCLDLLIVVGRSVEWVDDAVLEVLVPFGEKHRISLEILDNLRDAERVTKHLGEFGLVAQPSDADAAALTEALRGQRLFCVRSSKQASFARTLERLGFAVDPEQFVEEVVAPAQNSNLVQLLNGKSEHFDWLLYAWAGLRTLPSEIKKKFSSGSLEADSPMKVCTMLKRRLLKRFDI